MITFMLFVICLMISLSGWSGGCLDLSEKKCGIAEKSVGVISTEDGFQRTDSVELGENPAFVPGLMSNFSEDPQKAKLYHQVEAK